MPISQSGNIAVTLGDPAGIGPEVALRALKRLSYPRVLLIGPVECYRVLARRLRIRLEFNSLLNVQDWKPKKGSYSCFYPFEYPKSIRLGRADSRASVAAVRSIETAVLLAMGGSVDAVVTPPINKAGLKKAGFDIPGHTEYLAQLSRVSEYEMMLVGGNLRVVLVTRHVALADVSRRLTQKRVERAILNTDRELRRLFGIRRPRLVVCGLNPHAGEEGRFGREEIDVISPAVRAARKKTNARIVGPLSPDALFHDAYLGHYDAEICMYHDQGLIPLKMISRGFGVNVTLGLPFVRTSPDHGTAYDIAPRLRADSGSMEEALRLASRLSGRLRHGRSRPRR